MYHFDFLCRYLVRNDCIPPLCDLLGAQDPRIILVALNGLDNILRSGKEEAKNTGVNQHAIAIEECKGKCSFFVFVNPILHDGWGYF